MIERESIDIAFNAPMGQVNAHFNDFDPRTVGVDNIGTGTVSATESWWGCVLGPGTGKCASTTGKGKGITVSPWLLSPFNDDRKDHDR